MSEQWLPVVGYEGFYVVSERGQVRRIAGGHGTKGLIILKTHLGRGGYPRVSLCKDGKSRRPYLHSVVAAAFLGPRPAGKEINHKDSDRQNPTATNLEYVTRSENMRHAYLAGRVRGCIPPRQKVEQGSPSAVRLTLQEVGA